MANTYIAAGDNEYTNVPWPNNLPDVPFFLQMVLEVPREDCTVPMLRQALIASANALMTGDDALLDAWGERYGEGWGQS